MRIAAITLTVVLSTCSAWAQNSQPGYRPAPEMSLFPKKVTGNVSKPGGSNLAPGSQANPAAQAQSGPQMRLFPTGPASQPTVERPVNDGSALNRQITSGINPEMLQYMSPEARAAIKKAQTAANTPVTSPNLFSSPTPITPQQKADAAIANALSRRDVQDALKNQGRR